jgi:diketogulonate reductase-like aldo/keto reductase
MEALLLTTFVMAEENRSIKLNSGFEMPVLGLGTWTLTGETCENAVYEALKSGYRLIDTARYYGNESEVGKAVARAIKEGICTREEIFVTTKLVPWTSTPEDDIDDSLQKLGLSYIDLCLLHQHYVIVAIQWFHTIPINTQCICGEFFCSDYVIIYRLVPHVFAVPS